ncbi:MAG: hypothetical protein IPJ74_25570 [Saprospiraceae bacterium]|nr:hypothetical protein [Saprospiraceae bacterium]
MHNIKLNKWLLLYWLIAIITLWLVRNHVFFWDTVQLGSKHAHWYYENNFKYLLLPEEIDSGHPPIFGMYLATLWKIFGKSLTVSHFAMLPFVLGIIYFLLQIGKYLVNEKYAPLLVLLNLLDPTLAAQCLLISPDVILVCFFLMGLYAVLEQKNWLKTLAMLGLAMISMRGMMVVMILFLLEITISSNSWQNLLRISIQKVKYYIPAGLFTLAFLIIHYQQAGWIGYHPDSPWSPSFARVDAKGFFKNIAVLGWRILEFGRIFIWIILIIILLQKKFQDWWQDATFRSLFSLFIFSILLLTPSLLLHQGLSAQRYLLPIYLSLTFLVFYLIFNYLQYKKNRSIAFMIAFVGLSTGNLWIYPDKISQGWDATLAHLPYYQLRTQMLDFIEQQGIPPDSIGTAFPEIGPFKFKDLSDRTEGFVEKDLQKQDYILYSNVMNDFSDAEIDKLQKNWTLIKQLKKRGIRAELYHKRLDK